MFLYLKQNYFYIFLLLSISIPFSKFALSLFQIILAILWLIEGGFKKKFNILLKNTPLLLFSLFYLMHIAGIFYSTDINYALKDIRIKLPLFTMPVLIGTTFIYHKFGKKELEIILVFFLISVFASTVFDYFYYLYNKDIIIYNPRKISYFISHIRLSIMCVFCIFTALYFLIYGKNKAKFLFLIPLIFIVFFLFLLNALTGIILLVISLIIFLIFFTNFNFKPFLTISIILALSLIILSVSIVYKEIKNFYNTNTAYNKELLKNNVLNSHNKYALENGNYILLGINEKELKDEWNQRSKIPYNGKDHKGQYIKNTLIRFLSSKSLPKNAEGVKKLKKEEIEAIENGIANYRYINPSLSSRIYEIIWELNNYIHYNDINGHSVVLRFIYWKTAYKLIKENPLIGVGTGDIQNKFFNYLKKNYPQINKKWIHRSHNQFLSIAVSFGIIGLLFFVFLLFYPFIFFKGRKLISYIPFFFFYFTIILSMLTEDTLETQVGVSYFAFFTTLFISYFSSD